MDRPDDAPRLTPEHWAFIYRAWIVMSYAWQVGGVIWIVLGLSLTVWLFTTQDIHRITLAFVASLTAALVVPSAAMFFGAWRVRRWTQKRLASLQRYRVGKPMSFS